MSAWIVSKAHVDVLVHALSSRGLLLISPDEAGQILWRENHTSVNYRYREHTRTPSYTYTEPIVTWTPAAVLRQVHCYDYQTCEHPTYQDSHAHAMVHELIDAFKRERVSERSKAYNDAPWGVHDCGLIHDLWEDCPAEGTPEP